MQSQESGMRAGIGEDGTPMEASTRIDTLVAERNAALFSLEEARIRAYAAKYGTALPADPDAFWSGVHLARLRMHALPAAEWVISRAWLAAHGWEEDAYAPLGWRLRR